MVSSILSFERGFLPRMFYWISLCSLDRSVLCTSVFNRHKKTVHHLNIHLNYVYNCKFLQYMIKKNFCRVLVQHQIKPSLFNLHSQHLIVLKMNWMKMRLTGKNCCDHYIVTWSSHYISPDLVSVISHDKYNNDSFDNSSLNFVFCYEIC